MSTTGPELTQPDGSATVRTASGPPLAAVTLIVIQLWLKTELLAGSYFRQDDYRFLDRAVASGFGWTYLMWIEAGHLLPIGLTIAWAQARASLYNWPLACVVILILVAAASVAMVRMLRTLFGNRPAILVPLAVFLFSPLSLAGSDWWAVAIEILPLEAAMFMAVDAHVRYLRGGGLRHAVAAAAWLAAGMAASDKGALVPLLLVALTAAFFVDKPGAVRRYWRAWLLYGVLLGGYIAVFATRLPASDLQYHGSSASDVLSFTSTLFGTNLLPAALGGPWRWLPGLGYAQAAPPEVLQQLAWAVTLIVVVASCALRVRAWRAWAILLGWITVAVIVPVLVGRLGAIPGTVLGLQTRYLADAAGVLALVVGLAFLPLDEEPGAYRMRAGALKTPARAGAIALTCAFLVGSVVSLDSLKSTSTPGIIAARSYIATARTALAAVPRGTVIVGSRTPAAIMDPGFFGTFGGTSQVLGAITRTEPSRHLTWASSLSGAVGSPMIFDDQGQLLPLTLVGPSSKSPLGCLTVTASGVSIPLAGPLFRWPWTVRLAYSGPAGQLRVGLGGASGLVTLPAGAHVAYLALTGAGRSVRVQPGQPAMAAGCVTAVTVGTVRADLARAVPAAPVPG